MIDGSGNEDTQRTIAKLRIDLLAEHLGKEAAEVEGCFRSTNSLIGCIETMRGSGRTLVPFEPKEPNKLEKKLAKSEMLDPEGPDELFERRARPGLLSGLRRRGRRS